MLQEIKEYVTNYMNHPGHKYSHVIRVFNTCKRICDSNPKIDRDVLLPAALLHDIARADEMVGKIKNHAEEGAYRAVDYLRSIGYYPNKIDKIFSAIRTHRWSEGLTPKTLEAKILQEADRIDAIGAIGIIRTTLHNKRKPLYHPRDPFANKRELDDKTYAIDHFFVKLLKIKDTISTEEVRKEAEVRHNYMIKFLNQLGKDIENGNGPALELIKMIKDNYSLNTYDINNPFGNPNTIVGKIAERKEQFFQEFIERLKSEIL